VSAPTNGDDSDRTGQLGVEGDADPGATRRAPLGPTREVPVAAAPESAPPTGTWVGRARATPPLPPPVDPYWPPMEQDRYHPGPPILVAHPPRTRRGTALIAIGVVAAVCAIGSLLILLGTALSKEAGLGFGDNPAATPTPSPTPPPAPGVGDPVSDGRFEFTVTKVECGQKQIDAGFFDQKAKGQYCIVSFKVENIGKEAQTFSEAMQEAIDEDGNSHKTDTIAGALVNAKIDSWWHSVAPGDTYSAKMVFDIPKNAELATLELHEAPFSKGAVVTL
jgi:hypothetical protein